MAARSYRALLRLEEEEEEEEAFSQLTQYGAMSRPSRGKYTIVFSLVRENAVKWNRFK